MRKYFKLLLLILLCIFLIDLFSALYSLYAASQLTERTYTDNITILNQNKTDLRVLFLGDSLAAGVGSSSINTSAYGRFANYLSTNYSVTFSNKAKSGNEIENLLNVSIENNYDLIVVSISSNDLLMFTQIDDFKSDLEIVLEGLSNRSENVMVVGPGRLFETTGLPFWLSPVYKYRSSFYSNVLNNVSSNYDNVLYINPLEEVQLNEYEEMEAKDNFHPNDEGHRYWFDLIVYGWNKID